MLRARGQQRGIVAVMVAIALVGVLIMVGLGIDIGHVVLNKSRLQSAVDSAALQAAKMLDDGATTAAVEEWAEGPNGAFALNAAKFPELRTAALVPTVEFSNTLNPFVPGSLPAEYVRVTVENFPTKTTFSRLLPGGYRHLGTRASAVSGPSAPIENPCGLFPVAVCADLTKGPPHWGYATPDEGGSAVTLLKLASGAAGQTLGPGNFQLLRLEGMGANVVRRSLAAGAACVKEGSLVEVELQPGNLAGPVAQGTNTRFGIYNGPVARADYAPDFFKTPSPATPLDASKDGKSITYNGHPVTGIGDVAYSYVNYQAEYTACGAACQLKPETRRRVVVVPIVDCSHQVQGASKVAVKGFGCFFLLQPVRQGGSEAWMFGQFVDDCRASGTPGEHGGTGPYTIVLHNDPDSEDS
jgi:hypothetical protein